MALIPTFEQQGTVNWDNLVQQSVTFSVGLLSRLSNYGIDPYSLQVGQYIAQDFVLSSDGQRSVLKALESLTGYRGYASTLWCGFGIDSFARILSKTDQGCSLLALCAALSETFGEEFAARTMHALVKLKKAPSHLTPSVAQWLMIVKACAGVLSTSKFPILVESFLRLITPETPRTREQMEGTAPRPQHLAKVLDALGRLSTGQLKVMTVDGLDPTAWIGAVSEWLYGMRVSFEDEDGHLIYASNGQLQETQCRIRATSSQPEEVVHVSGASYQLDSYRQLFGHRPGDFVTDSRVSWEFCLSAGCRDSFDDIMASSEVVGQTFGCAARILDSLLVDRIGIREQKWPHISEFSEVFLWSTSDLMDFMVLQFPELQPAHASMLAWYRRSPKEAMLGLDEALYYWNYCSSKEDEFPGNDDHDLVLFHILRLAITLFETDFPGDLLPTRYGLRSLFLNRRHVNTAKSFIEELTKIDELIIGMVVFSGSSPDFGQVSAGSSNGICVYRQILSGVKLDRQHFHRLCIVPGQILFEGKPYHEIRDAHAGETENVAQSNCSVLDPEFCEMTELAMMITASSTKLGAYFTLRDPQENHKYYTFRPYRLVDSILRSTWLSSWCSGNTGSACWNSILERVKLRSCEKPWIQLRLWNLDIPVLFANSTQANHCAAVFTNPQRFPVQMVGANCCIYCCLKGIARRYRYPCSGHQRIHKLKKVFVVVQGLPESDWFWTPWNLDHAAKDTLAS